MKSRAHLYRMQGDSSAKAIHGKLKIDSEGLDVPVENKKLWNLAQWAVNLKVENRERFAVERNFDLTTTMVIAPDPILKDQ